MQNYITTIKAIFDTNRARDFITVAMTGKKYTYEDVLFYSLKLARFFEEKGIKKGEKVAIFLPNCVEYIFTYFACMHIGAVAVPINHKLHLEEVKHILVQIEPFILITSKEYEHSLQQLMPQEKILAFNLQEDVQTFFSLISLYEINESEAFSAITNEDLFAIVFTSGTTAKPKGVMIWYGGLLGNAASFVQALNLTPDLKFYNMLDLAYLGGIYNLTVIPFMAKASIVLAKAFNPQTAIFFWEEVIKYSINALWLVPSIASILLLVDRDDKGCVYAKNKIKIALIGTAPLSLSLRKKFEERYGITLYENYGLSETFFITTNSPQYGVPKGVGKVIERCSVIILDERGVRCPPREVGEIVVGSPYKMQGYYKQQGALGDMFVTGDVGYVDEDGFLYITDRKKDIIIRGGINISPREIEEVIANYPGVDEVVVVGIEHDYVGEDIIAVVKSKNNLQEKDLKAHCTRFLANFKIPSRFVIKEEFPRAVTGKVQKNQLKLMLRSQGNE